MPVIIMIRRQVKSGCEDAFLEQYCRDHAAVEKVPGFIRETLTKFADGANLPTSLRTLELGSADCIQYMNIAEWQTWEAFDDHFKPTETYFDETYEVGPRARAVLETLDLGIA